MPFSHHSHSGQFCPGHARNTLEEMVQTAIAKKMQVFAVTEHMPRHDEDRYPEEVESGTTMESSFANQAAFFAEASRLRDKYRGQIDIPIGFEADWVRPEAASLIERLLRAHPFDFWVGSVHHTHSIPIDYDRAMYIRARDVAGGSDDKLAEDYFDLQLSMLQAMRPPVVGHFDLIRLKSDNPDVRFQSNPSVWRRILRNLDFIVSYGGLLEINFASLRKGLLQPYPEADICKVRAMRAGSR